MKYSSHSDVYTYKDAPDVLINNFNIKDAKELEKVEQAFVLKRISAFNEYPQGSFDLKHWQTMHKHLFQDVYPWAGEIRQVTTIKGNTIFCKPEYIESVHAKIYKELKNESFLEDTKIKELPNRLAYYHSEYNMVHPFREGNSRSLRAVFTQVTAKHHNIKLNFNKIGQKEWIEASIAGGATDYSPMEHIYKRVITDAINNDKKQTKNNDLSR